MANRFWVGGSAAWDATAGTKWSATSGGAGGASVPTAADDVFFDANSGTATVTVGAAAMAARSLTMTGSTITFVNGGAFNLSIGDASGGALTLAAGTSGFSTLNGVVFAATSTNGGAGWAITTAGKAMPGGVTFSGVGGKWVLQDAFTTGGVITLTAGTLDTNSQSVTAGTFSSSNSNTRSLILGTSTVTVTATGTSWNMSTATGLTLSVASSTIILSGSSVSPTFGTSTSWGTVIFSGSGIPVLANQSYTFVNLTRTGTASKTDGFQINGNFTVTGTFTVAGNSAVNRMLVLSNTVGTARTITAAAVVASNVDFMDITAAGAANWNLSAIAGLSGDAGGNTGITFTPSATQTHTASAGGSWSDPTKWTSRVPLPQDDVIVDVNTTGTLTMDMPRAGRSLTFTGFAGTLATSTPPTVYGSFTLSSALTASLTNSVTFAGRGSYSITSAGKQISPGATPTITAPGGTYTFIDAFSAGSSGSFLLNNGTLDTNSQSVTSISFTSTNANVRSLLLGSTTWSIAGTGAGSTPWSLGTSTNMTLSAALSTIAYTGATANTRNFNGGGLTYGTLTYTVANSPGVLAITGANTFGTLNVGSGRHVMFPSSTTTTVGAWNVNGANQGYIYLPGAAGSYISTPDAVANSITGDITIDIKLALADWTPATLQSFGKYNNNQRSYRVDITAGGFIQLYVSTDGVNDVASRPASTVAAGVADGATKWVRVTRTAATGSTRYYLSDDGVTWTQLGTTVVGTSGNIFDSTSVLELGSIFGGTTNPITGNIYAFKLYNSDLGNGAGTPVQSFDAALHVTTTDTYTGPSGAVWTLNGQAKEGDGRVIIDSSTGGTAGTVSASSGTIQSSFLTLQDNTATGGAAWWAGSSRSVSNVTGWNFGWIITSASPAKATGASTTTASGKLTNSTTAKAAAASTTTSSARLAVGATARPAAAATGTAAGKVAMTATGRAPAASTVDALAGVTMRATSRAGSAATASSTGHLAGGLAATITAAATAGSTGLLTVGAAGAAAAASTGRGAGTLAIGAAARPAVASTAAGIARVQLAATAVAPQAGWATGHGKLTTRLRDRITSREPGSVITGRLPALTASGRENAT